MSVPAADEPRETLADVIPIERARDRRPLAPVIDLDAARRRRRPNPPKETDHR